ncbi:MAG TPA: ROK family protein, partial [Pyrinomonadaceae bacterium]|nr:ROK family protein [Pyrinomonadaceae bacterium]
MTSTATSVHYLGVDISGATMRAALVAADGEVAARREAALEPNAIGTQVARVVSELRDAQAAIAALGVGVPGLVNPETGRVVVSTDLPAVVRNDLRAELQQATGLPITFENDANAAA